MAPTIMKGSAPVATAARQRRVGRIMGKILATGEEAHERAAIMRDVVANRPAQHRIARFDGVEHRALGDWPGNFDCYLAIDLRELAQIAPEA